MAVVLLFLSGLSTALACADWCNIHTCGYEECASYDNSCGGCDNVEYDNHCSSWCNEYT